MGCRKVVVDLVPRFLSPPVSDWRNRNIVFAANLCQTNVGQAKFLCESPHWSRPDFFVEFGASQADSFLSAG